MVMVLAQTLNAPTAFTLEWVIDGDTITADGEKIRLWGIDAPEKGEPLYKDSTAALRTFLEGARLECQPIERDRYKRMVMHCFANDDDLGALMVKAGFARDYARYSDGFYAHEERFAQDARLGIWKSLQ